MAVQKGRWHLLSALKNIKSTVRISKDVESYSELIINNYKNTDKSDRNIALRLSVWSVLYAMMKNDGKHAIEKRKDKFIRIAMIPSGGAGDYIIFANWLWYFSEHLCTNNCTIDVFYHIATAKGIFENHIVHRLYPIDKFDITKYDVSFEFHVVYPEIGIFRENHIEHLNGAMHKYILLCRKFYKENRILLDHAPYLSGWGTAKAEINGIKRIQQPDIYHCFEIDEDYRYPIPYDSEKATSYLKKLGLYGKRFITIHRGWNVTDLYPNVKAWSIESCGDVIYKLKKKYPGYVLVLVASSREQTQGLRGADLDLVEKTSFEEIKYLLKNAVLHIDNEGGMVHLRHALCKKPSVVMFGPTSEKVFGYSENINIRGGGCEHWCEWYTPDWQYHCVKGETSVPCMKSIMADDIINAIEKRHCL